MTLRSNPCVRFRTSARRTLGALTLALLPSTWACSAADEPDAAFGGSPGQSGSAGAPAPSGGTSAGLGGAPFGTGGTSGAPTTGGSSTGGASGNGGAALGGGGVGAGTSSAGGAPAQGGASGMGASGSGGLTGGVGGSSGGAASSGAGGTSGGNANTGGSELGGNGGAAASPSDGGTAGTLAEGGADAGAGGSSVDPDCPKMGSITYTLNRAASPTPTQQMAYQRIESAMEEAVAFYNCHTEIEKRLSVSYEPSVPTADGNVNGSIRFGSTDSMNPITAMHEIAHTLGVGSNEFRALVKDGIFIGELATNELRAITGDPTEEVHSDGTHFWPYGLNYTSEVMSDEDLLNHCRMVVAIRADMGL
ncbi:MAG TPA: hypothetical protein VKY73_22730 [Polyangiaceae bacterium]|nr:hypothetical protein [Polyangiaceae bacterium]